MAEAVARGAIELSSIAVHGGLRMKIPVVVVGLLLLVNCGSDSSGGTGSSTSTVTARTIEGVCGKYKELSCALPNCQETMTLAQERCEAGHAVGVLQRMPGCRSIATISCRSDGKPYVANCHAEISEAETCSR